MKKRCSDCRRYRSAECQAEVPAIVIVEAKLGKGWKDWGVFTYTNDEDAAEYCALWQHKKEGGA